MFAERVRAKATVTPWATGHFSRHLLAKRGLADGGMELPAPVRQYSARVMRCADPEREITN
jgi:hypothetical protein